MRGIIAKAAIVVAVLVVATNADAQRHHRRVHRETERAPPVSVDKRDSMVTAPGAFAGKPYWLVLAQCGGIYFKLNTLYTDAAVHARVVHPDPHANAVFTKKLQEAISIATTFFNAAASFLMTDRGLERDNAVLTYDGPSRAAGDRVKTIDAALEAAMSCPRLYQACTASHPKACSGTLGPLS